MDILELLLLMLDNDLLLTPPIQPLASTLERDEGEKDDAGKPSTSMKESYAPTSPEDSKKECVSTSPDAAPRPPCGGLARNGF